MDDLRFEFRIVRKDTDETVIEDHASITEIDQFGGCESVDMHVAAALRALRRQLARNRIGASLAE